MSSQVRHIHQRHLWEQIADDLREAIHKGELPAGTRLVTAELATRWGVSRGPVREALMALENEGIVVSTRRHGTIVGAPSTVDLDEVLWVREAIETFAGVAVCDQIDLVPQTDLRRLAELLDKVDKARAKGDSRAAMTHDFAFHQSIVALAGNSRFSTIYRQMISQNTHHMKGVDPETWPYVGWDVMRAAHHALLDALVAGDGDAFKSAVAVHYQNARRRMSPATE